MSKHRFFNRSGYTRIALIGAISIVAIALLVSNAKPTAPQQNVSQWLGLEESTSSPTLAKPVSVSTSVAPVNDLVGGLKKKLEEKPDDVNGWVLLAKSYLYMGQKVEAESAFAKAQALGYEGALRLQENPKPKVAELASELRRPLPENSFLNQYLSGRAKVKLNQQNAKAAHQNSSDAKLLLSVKLDPQLASTLKADQSVFIFVRSANVSEEAGQPPLVALRKQVSDLPLYLAIDDQMSLQASRKMSSAKQVIVGARVSSDGDPRAKPGDFERQSAPLSTNRSETVSLIISAQSPE